MLIEQNDVSKWRDDIQSYHKGRTHRGFDNPKVEIITQKTMKLKEQIFNPLLQHFNDPVLEKQDQKRTQEKVEAAKLRQQDSLDKYQKDFNIINLSRLYVQQAQDEQGSSIKSKANLKPAARDFNIITNTHHFSSNSQLFNSDQDFRQSNDFVKRQRDFNIISNLYTINHEEKNNKDNELVKSALQTKYDKSRYYNLIAGQCYNPEKEEIFQKELKEQQTNHGKDANQKLPPSLRYRETVMFDSQKGVTDEVKLLDEQKLNAKKRYKLRYAVESEYHQRNIEQEDRKQERLLKGLCEDKYLDEHKKGFDLITLEKKRLEDLEKLINKKPNLSSWDKVQSTKKDDYYNPKESLNSFSRTEFVSKGGQKGFETSQQRPGIESSSSSQQAVSANSSSNKFRIKTGGFNG